MAQERPCGDLSTSCLGSEKREGEKDCRGRKTFCRRPKRGAIDFLFKNSRRICVVGKSNFQMHFGVSKEAMELQFAAFALKGLLKMKA